MVQRAAFRRLCPEIYYEQKHAPSPMKQRPQQSFKRRADLKIELKVTPKEAKVAKGPTDSSGVREISPGSSRKPEVKKQEEEKKSVPLSAPVEPPLQGGHYELNARMTRIVETELRDIMIKVWHELPDNPSDDAESLVVEKLRNQAGDDFRNVLGLNITKRLLNVHNPLHVKVQFSGKPEKVHLGEFLKKYNFTAFKRIEKTVNMFAAQVKTINDFDRICSAKDIRCGDIKVTVSPIYKFTKCPPNLITNFDGQRDASNGTAETTEKEEKLEEKTEIIAPEKVTKQTESDPPKPKVETGKTENVTKVEKLVSKPVENKTVVSKPATENKPLAKKPVSKPTVENKAAVKPVIANKAAVSKPEVENKTAAIKPTVENKTAASKPTVEIKTAVNKPAVVNKTTLNKTPVKANVEKNVVNKPTAEQPVSTPVVQNKTVTKHSVDNLPAATKPAVENKNVVNKTAVVNKPATNIKTVAKPIVENKVVKKPDLTPKINDTGKKPALSPVKTPIKIDEKADKTNKDDDYDELDDHDILALMATGIVLDECSGSDDE